jgi:predicted glycosyltransferase
MSEILAYDKISIEQLLDMVGLPHQPYEDPFNDLWKKFRQLFNSYQASDDLKLPATHKVVNAWKHGVRAPHKIKILGIKSIHVLSAFAPYEFSVTYQTSAKK